MDLNGEITRAALGRNGVIGNMYNVINEDIFITENILKPESPLNNFVKSIQCNESENSIHITTADTLQEKFDVLQVVGEMQLSFISNELNMNSSVGLYIENESSFSSCFKKSLCCRIYTTFETLDLDSINRAFIDLRTLNHSEGTHFIWGVKRGFDIIIMVEEKLKHEEDEFEISQRINAVMGMIKSCIQGETIQINELTENLQNLHVRLFGDVIPEVGVFQNGTELFQFVSQLPSLIDNKVREGKGNPLHFSLRPIHTLRQMLGLGSLNRRTFQNFPDQEIKKMVAIVGDLINLCSEFNHLESLIETNVSCFTNLSNMSFKHEQEHLWTYVREERRNIQQYLMRFRRREITHGFSFNNEIPDFKIILNRLNYIKRVVYLFNLMTEYNGTFLLNNSNLNEELETVENGFVLFISQEFWNQNKKLFEDNVRGFVKMVKRKFISAKFIVCDLNLNPSGDQIDTVEDACIWQVEKSEIKSKNYFIESLKAKDLNLAYSSVKYKHFLRKPRESVKLQTVCPIGLKDSSCEYCILFWNCKYCLKKIECGFDGYFYCSCGKGKYEDYVYRCNNEIHDKFIEMDQSILEEFIERCKNRKQLNVLVLGATGVGKSTWLNSLVNYVLYDSLDSAKKGGVMHILPVRFIETDEDYEEHEIILGKADSSEVVEIGESGTQNAKTYTFLLDNLTIRFIDTPGIGDCRGLDQDKLNMKNILEHISYLDEIHGICILLKPGESRLTTNFKFCINELLRQLHKSASKNIIFCFTHSRGTHFKPSGTLPILKELMEKSQINLNLSAKSVFCMDNESFRYLCAIEKSKIKFSAEQINDFIKSWDHSVSVTSRIIEHLTTLEPHKIKDTMNLNETRRIILAMAKPMADISNVIVTNMASIEKQKKNVESLKSKEALLQSNLTIRTVELVAETLATPQTVCANYCCTEQNFTADRISLTRYSQVCHKECKARNVPECTLNTNNIKYCRALKNRKACIKCGCEWKHHMHMLRTEKWVIKEIEQTSTREQLKTNRSNQADIENYIKETMAVVIAYNCELELIRRIAAKLNNFLNVNGILIVNDAMESYICQLIEEKKTKKDSTEMDKNILKRLEQHLKDYQKEKDIFESSESNCNHPPIANEDIQTLKEELLNLKLTGKLFRNHLEVSEASMIKAMHYREYVIDSKSFLSNIQHTSLKLVKGFKNFVLGK